MYGTARFQSAACSASLHGTVRCVPASARYVSASARCLPAMCSKFSVERDFTEEGCKYIWLLLLGLWTIPMQRSAVLWVLFFYALQLISSKDALQQHHLFLLLLLPFILLLVHDEELQSCSTRWWTAFLPFLRNMTYGCGSLCPLAWN